MLAPSSHLEVILQEVTFPKVLIIKRMLSEITGIPADDPALIRCMFSIGAPNLMLLVSGRTYAGSWREVFQMPAEVVAEHLYQFALGGLAAVGNAYKRQQSPWHPRIVD